MSEKTFYPAYPRCETCRHFETFFSGDGSPGMTVCVRRAPTIHPQIAGMGKEGGPVWSAYSGWPNVFAHQRCGEHEPADKAKN